MKNATKGPHLLFLLTLALAMFTGLNCEVADTSAYLGISITGQPQGGPNVNEVSCTYRGIINCPDEKAAEKIEVTTHWESPHGIYNEEVHTWTWSGVPETKTFTSSKSAPPGMYLDKPFWFVIRWTDANGTWEVLSDTAYCL